MKDEQDTEHLIESQAYGEYIADDIIFVTDDRNHILSNKAEIEKFLKFLTIESFENWKINIKYLLIYLTEIYGIFSPIIRAHSFFVV